MRVAPHIPIIFVILWMTCGPALSASVSDPTAKKALRRLTSGEAQRLAKIVATGGTPVPESWHVLSYDPTSETGIKERVIADGAISDGSENSEYAGYLTDDDIIGRRAVKIDTDRVFNTANQYALANDLLVASMNYTLEKNELGEAVWRVECIGENGAMVGSLVIAADKGDVLAREGFPIEPTLTATKQKKGKSRSLKLATDADETVSAEADEESEEEAGAEVAAGTRDREPARHASGKKSNHVGSSRSVRKARRSDADDVARTVTRPVRRVLRRVLPF